MALTPLTEADFEELLVAGSDISVGNSILYLVSCILYLVSCILFGVGVVFCLYRDTFSLTLSLLHVYKLCAVKEKYRACCFLQHRPQLPM